MNKGLIKKSKFMSLLLRHSPETINLRLDENGWAEIDDLITLSAKHDQALTLSDIEEIVATNEKKRFSFNEDKSKVRANQGHSISVDVELREMAPPEHLYHGTATRFLESILSQGLIKNSRQHVHLSADIKTAKNVGQRHGKPIVLSIPAKKMHDDGYLFYLSENNVWLTDEVPAQYLESMES